MANSRPLIVVDKCFVQGAKKGLLHEFGKDFRLVPTDVLLFEIRTDEGMGRSTEKRLRTEIGNQCPVSLWDLMALEITQGIPGWRALRSEDNWVTIDAFSGHWNGLFLRQHERLFAADARRLLHMQHPDDPAFHELLRVLRRSGDIYNGLAHFAKERGPEIASDAKKVGVLFAAQDDWKVHDGFAPEDGWATFGYYLTLRATDIQNLWRFGPVYDPQRNKEPPANYGADLHYLMWSACAEGLITNDPKMLPLAWAMYPAKREHLYQYDQDSASLRVFQSPSPARRHRRDPRPEG